MSEVATITTLPANGDVSEWTPAQIAIVEAAGLVFTHTYGTREGDREAAPRAVVEKFLHACRTTGLDPINRQIYCIGRLSGNRVDWSIQTSIDGFRVIAERSQKYSGQGDTEWMTEKGDWVDVFVKQLHGDHPLAARVRVYRSDWEKPATGIATWESYAQTKRNGEPTAMWLKMGPLMLAKCAEALGLRKAFPQDLSGLYTADEMSQAVPEVAQAPAAAADRQLTAEQVPRAVAPQQAEKPVETVQKTKGVDFVKLADKQTTAEGVMEVYGKAREAGALAQNVDFNGEMIELREYLRKLGTAFRTQEEAKAIAEASPKEDVIDAEVVDDDSAPSAIWDTAVIPDVDSSTGEVK